MATVTKRGDTWTAIFKDRNGKQVWLKGFADKKETLRLAQDREDEERKVSLGHVDPQADARRNERSKSAIEHLDAFRAHMESNARARNHVEYTIRDCRLCIEFCGIDQAGQITLAHIDKWRVHLMNVGVAHHSTGRIATDSRKTVNRRIASVRAFLRYCAKVGALDRVVLDGYKMLDTKGHETRHRRSLSKNEAAKLIAGTTDANRRELYRFAMLTGFRRSEIASMTPANFDFKNRTVTIVAKDAKFKGEHQTIPLHSGLIKPLKALCEGRAIDAPIFAVPRKQDVVEILHADCKAAGVKTNNVDFHGLRHSFITHLAEQNIRPEVLMKLARHRDIKTTLRHYVHFRPDDERAAMERITAY